MYSSPSLGMILDSSSTSRISVMSCGGFSSSYVYWNFFKFLVDAEIEK